MNLEFDSLYPNPKTDSNDVSIEWKISRHLRTDDIDGFKEYLDSDDMLDFPEPEVFDSQEQAIAFCEGLDYGTNERDMPNRYPFFMRNC